MLLYNPIKAEFAPKSKWLGHSPMILSYAFNHFMRSYKENRKQYVETIMCEENIRTMETIWEMVRLIRSYRQYHKYHCAH